MRKWKHFENELAWLVNKREIKGIIKQDIIIKPGEAAILIKDGKIEDIVTQTRLKNIGGGFTNWLAKKLSVGEDLELMFLDIKPFEIEYPLSATSKDYVDIKGTATVQLQFNLEEAAKVIGMVKAQPVYEEKGIIRKRIEHVGFETFLTTEDLEKRFEKEAKAMVFTTTISNYTASEFHGNLRISKG